MTKRSQVGYALCMPPLQTQKIHCSTPLNILCHTDHTTPSRSTERLPDQLSVRPADRAWHMFTAATAEHIRDMFLWPRPRVGSSLVGGFHQP